MRHPQDLPRGKPGRTEKTLSWELDDPTKFWKFDISDLEARDRWDEYMFAWQEVFEKTSTAAAPWYLVPADNRWYSRAVVSELLRTTLKNMNMTWPPLDPRWTPTRCAAGWRERSSHWRSKRMAQLFAWLRPLAGGVA